MFAQRFVLWLIAVVACAAWLPDRTAHADCPVDMIELNCGGLPVCKPPGSSCCGDVACSSDLICLNCNGNAICAAPGSMCCGNVMCPPGQDCVTCGTSTRCRPRGEGCPDDMD